ncbi:hypothetical protein DESC_690005 [Desulfosarcina cetonica]|nr:hypothetical protein DESC_690005 [Desulfosarcina cetonica]
MLETFQGFRQDRPRTSEVNAFETIAFGAENVTFIRKDACLLQHQAFQGPFIQSQTAAVQPDQIGPLGADRPEGRQVRIDVAFHEIAVGLDIGQDLVQPGFAFAIGGLASHHAERVGPFTQTAAVEGLLETPAQFRVGNNDVGGVQAGQVEGLAGRGTHHGIIGERRVDGGKGRENHPFEDQVGMDLVSHHQHLVLPADLADTGQFLTGPHPSHGVVRAAEDEQGDGRIGRLGFEIGEIHGVTAILQDQAAGNDLGPVVLDGSKKRVVDGPLDQDFFPRPGKGAHQPVHRRHHPGRGEDPAGIDGPAVPPPHPVHHGLVVAVRAQGIAVNAVLGTTHQGVDHRLGRGKVHVGHPERQHPVFAEIVVGGDPARRVFRILDDPPFGGLGVLAIDLVIEIDLHDAYTLSLIDGMLTRHFS